MDISDTEMSDVFETDAEASDEFESDVADEDWIESRKKIRRKQSQNYQNRKSTLEDNIPVGNLSEKPNEEAKIKGEKVGFEQCCSCSRVSSCKTKRCECRALSGVCSTYCGCVPSKCSNREGCGKFFSINPDAAKQGRRKKWRKSTIQLVLTEPLQSSFPQDSEAPRNSARAGESVNGNKEVRGIIPPRSPVRVRKASDEKENHMA
ncbi:hypothetical protein BHE74_00024255 [Ensete ventricosum]|nr:hypothetical protein BHE74_00024255 [Ensete ventricosum]